MLRVHLGGHLSWYDAEKRSWLDVPAAGPLSLRGLLSRLGVPSAEVSIVAVNGKLASLEAGIVADGDKVEFYPPMGGG
jgi:sulfur carrier protein ThiS